MSSEPDATSLSAGLEANPFALPGFSSVPRFETREQHNSPDEVEAAKYWTTQLKDAKRCVFPLSKAISGSGQRLRQPKAHMKKEIAFLQSNSATITAETLLRAAWVILLAKYSDSDDICFGATGSGATGPIDGLDSIDRPLPAVIPVRALLRKHSTVHDLLQELQMQASEMVPFEQFGLRKIAKLSRDAEQCCNFSSLLIIQPASSTTMLDVGTDVIPNSTLDPALTLQLQTHNGYVESFVSYDSGVLAEAQVNALFHHFDHVVQQLLSPGDMLLRNISMAASWDLQLATTWNEEGPEIINECVHHMIAKQAQQRPDAPAICAWNGELTYSELNAASDRLARHLAREGVIAESLVHVCFEKSVWFFVSILAINKAGGAWVPLDPSHPIQRQQEIVRQTKSKFMLTSSEVNSKMCIGLDLKVIEVTAALDKTIADEETNATADDMVKTTLQLPTACETIPHNVAYVLFTSGSTGTPKGLVIEHGSLCTSQTAIRRRLGLTADVRMLQFGSYTFDACVGETYATLLSGGCVCVPSDQARWNGLVGFIRDKRVNSAFLTPSFVRTINPADVPSMSLLVVGGESSSQDILDAWIGKVRLFNGWGPAEVCVFGSLHEWKSASESTATIGKPVGGACWIVDPEDYERIMPIGCVGEIVIQGPTLLREYLSDRKRTEDSIVTSVPTWMSRRTEATWNRFFKTGDLGFHNPNGTIEFIGRKDTQVKIRGQRVELEEVEYNIRATMKEVEQVAVDILSTAHTRTSLVAYLCFSRENRQPGNDGANTADDLYLPLTDHLERQVRGMVEELKLRLPGYMIPTVFIPCQYMPSITSTKLDRAKLRRTAEALDRVRIARYSLSNSEKQVPVTPMEIQMQQLWASVLQVPAETIGRDDDFLQIGGDSISAISLVTLASYQGIVLTVTSIFVDGRLSSLATMAASAAAGVILPAPSPFSLMPDGRIDELLGQARRQCGLSNDQAIEDAYPCTPLQEGLVALSMRQPGSYMVKWWYKLSPHVDVARFKDAWERTVASCVALRTRIILANDCSFQVVVKNDTAWENQIDSHENIEMLPGSRLWRYFLTRGADGQTYFTLVAHHAVYDGWSIGLTLKQLLCFYEKAVTPALEPYSRFIRYVQGLNSEASAKYWATQLHEAKKADFPPRKAAKGPASSVTKILVRRIAFSKAASLSVTKATLLRAAWAIVLARYCDTRDVCFGVSVSGRNAPVPGLETMTGPLVATVPVRVRLNAKQTVADFLRDVQAQTTAMTPHEQFGLQNMIKLGQDARAACDFSSVLVIHPANILAGISIADSIITPAATTGVAAASEYFGYPLLVQLLLHERDVEFSATYDSGILDEVQATALSHHFDHVVQQLSSPLAGETKLGDVSLSGPWDLQQARAWNGESPEVINDCIHHMIMRHAQHTPKAPAICAWDGEFTYNELDIATDRLAHHLIGELGELKGLLVHVCFEKSIWFFVAILAINKAGGAWVPLDPSHPIQRQQEIVQQTKAKYALTSPANAEMCVGLGLTIVEVTAALRKVTEDDMTVATLLPPTCEVIPQDTAYILFTSGSTGTPKGLIMEHGSVCTSQVAITKRIGLTADVRMLQFSSYAFDAFIFEAIYSLMAGACICVPSETTRLTNLEDFINTMHITWVDLTPTFARILDLTKVPNVQVLVIGGEAASQDILRKASNIRLINVWGPAETCVLSTCHEYRSADESPSTIGKSVGGSCWIVEPDHSRLTPIGCVGEIIVQGPTLLREYLADRQRTEASIMTPPEWTPRGAEPNWGRCFKTGDLGYYNPDGTIEFVGRRDTQVKIRGQRVELGEIEYSIRSILTDIKQVAVDTLQSEVGISLVAYLCFSQETRLGDTTSRDIATNSMETDDEDKLFLPLTSNVEKQLQALAKELKMKLPGYMVPAMFVPCQYMPYIVSTKLDRAKLRRKTVALSREDRTRYSLVDSEPDKEAPETEMELQMQQLWASILQLPADSIGRSDSFLRIGGDSITAIRLVLLARRHGIALTVASIFEDARLSHVAGTAVVVS